MFKPIAKAAITFSMLALASAAVQAQTPAEFFKGKQVSLYIGFSAGGTYDLYGRVVARHLGKHIPGNPTVVPKNMEGAGSIRLTNFMYASGAEGRHRARHHGARRRLRAAVRHEGRAVRRRAIPLARQRQ